MHLIVVFQAPNKYKQDLNIIQIEHVLIKIIKNLIKNRREKWKLDLVKLFLDKITNFVNSLSVYSILVRLNTMCPPII